MFGVTGSVAGSQRMEMRRRTDAHPDIVIFLSAGCLQPKGGGGGGGGGRVLPSQWLLYGSSGQFGPILNGIHQPFYDHLRHGRGAAGWMWSPSLV